MPARRKFKVAAWLSIGALLLIYLASGLYIVDFNQEGVVRHFGRIVGDHLQPGIHFHWPWPIQRVDRSNVTDLQQLGLGFELGREDDISLFEVFNRQFLTGDRNIISVRLVVQYDISDPASFLFLTDDPVGLIRRSGEAAITRQLATMSVDDCLTTEQFLVAGEVQEQLQREMNSCGLGVRINAVQVKEIIHPRGVATAFNDVSSAREDYSRLINEAEGYANEELPRARSSSNRLLTDAASYKQERINSASGEADRFSLLAAEARRDRRSLQMRLYYETMDQIWPRLSKYMIGVGDRDGVTIRLFQEGVQPQPIVRQDVINSGRKTR